MSLVSVLGCGIWFFPIEEQLYCMLCLLIHNYSLFFRPVVSPLGGEDAPVVWRCGESPKAALRHPVCIGRLLPAPLSVAQQGQESWTSSPA